MVGSAVGIGLDFRGGGVTVVTVSEGSEVAGGAIGALGRGVAITVRVGGVVTVAIVEALSPPLTITTVAITAIVNTMPAIAATGRQC